MQDSGSGALVNLRVLARAREELGSNFARILGYFREDGYRSVAAIEAGMRAQRATALVMPAHTLKGEARQFGAEPLAELAEAVETIARDCVEQQESPGEALKHVAQLRPTFEATLVALEREANPLAARRTAFGRRSLG